MQNFMRDTKELREWIKVTQETAILELSKKSIVSGKVLESKTAWVFPYSILIGRFRDLSVDCEDYWFISANGILDYVEIGAAETPREVARYFSLKWQMDIEKAPVQASQQLRFRASSLYELTDVDELWLN